MSGLRQVFFASLCRLARVSTAGETIQFIGGGEKLKFFILF